MANCQVSFLALAPCQVPAQAAGPVGPRPAPALGSAANPLPLDVSRISPVAQLIFKLPVFALMFALGLGLTENWLELLRSRPGLIAKQLRDS